MTNTMKGFAKRFLYRTGYYHIARRLKGPRPPRLVVLMYHDVLDDAARAAGTHTDTESPTTTEFAAHVDEVARRYRVLTMRDAVDEIRAGGLREDTVAFTFDDGYMSVYTSAFRALARHEVPATVFVLTGWINREGHMWWQELRAIASRSTFSRATVGRVQSILGVDLVSGHGANDLRVIRRRFLEAAEPWLRGLEEETLAAHLQDLRDAALPGMSALSVKNQAMTWDQLRELQDSGFELAAHTHSHINLKHSTPESAALEIAKSKAEIERHAGVTPVGFAYPYGKDIDSYGPAADILRGDGFTYACTAQSGVNDDTTDPFYFQRIVVPNTTSAALITRELFLAFGRDA